MNLGTWYLEGADDSIAVKCVITFQLQVLMKEQKLNKTQLAKRMKTSRSALGRLPDPDNPLVTLLILGNVNVRASALLTL